MESLNRIALDTNAYVAFCRGVHEIVERVGIAETVYLPVIVLAELRAGFACGNQRLTNERRLISFLNSSRVEVLAADDDTTHHYARVFFQLRKQGTPIPTNDVWIAALAIQHGVALLTSDSHFEHIPQLLRG